MSDLFKAQGAAHYFEKQFLNANQQLVSTLVDKDFIATQLKEAKQHLDNIFRFFSSLEESEDESMKALFDKIKSNQGIYLEYEEWRKHVLIPEKLRAKSAKRVRGPKVIG